MSAAAAAPIVCGGATGIQAPTPEVQAMCAACRGDVCAQAGVDSDALGMFTCVGFRSQVVAGTNYFVSIQIQEAGFIHARIFVALPHVGEGPAVVAAKAATAADELTYF